MRRLSRLVTAIAVCASAASLIGCEGGNSAGSRAANVLYTESNDPASNKILAFSRASNGTVTPLPGSPFDLRGLGLANETEMLGPPDADNQVIVSSD